MDATIIDKDVVKQYNTEKKALLQKVRLELVTGMVDTEIGTLLSRWPSGACMSLGSRWGASFSPLPQNAKEGRFMTQLNIAVNQQAVRV